MAKMRKCKDNYIKLFEAMEQHSRDMAECWKNSDNAKKDYYSAKAKGQAEAFQEVIWILKDFKNSFEDYAKIYFPEGFEDENK